MRQRRVRTPNRATAINKPIQRPDTYQRLPEDVQLNSCEQQPVHTYGLFAFAAQPMSGQFEKQHRSLRGARTGKMRTKPTLDFSTSLAQHSLALAADLLPLRSIHHQSSH